MNLTGINPEEEFEKWYAQEKDKMPPFDDYMKLALYSFSKLAWLEASANLASRIERKFNNFSN